MKKFLIIIVLFLVPLVSSASFDANLKYGSKGQSVKEVQEFLTDQGVYNGPITGNFYSLTLKGIKNFQVAQNLTVSGKWGQPERDTANRLLDLGTDNTVDSSMASEVPPPGLRFMDYFAKTPAPTIDICANIEGNQTVIPVGLENNGGNCVVPTPKEVFGGIVTPWAPQIPTPPPIVQAPVILPTVDFSLSTPFTNTVTLQNNFTMWENTLTVGVQKVKLQSFKLVQIGSADSYGFANLRLYVDGVQVGSTVINPDSYKQLNFDLSVSPVNLEVGSHKIKVVGDIVGATSRTFAWSLQRRGDIVFDQQVETTGVPLPINSGNQTIQ